MIAIEVKLEPSSDHLFLLYVDAEEGKFGRNEGEFFRSEYHSFFIAQLLNFICIIFHVPMRSVYIILFLIYVIRLTSSTFNSKHIPNFFCFIFTNHFYEYYGIAFYCCANCYK